ncbi:MAG: hypothetical protein IJS15_06450 [Victivallales bacterium]|nr:hypothetical protein [Victivallales bacterium]
MIVKLDKCRNCGILREKALSGECAVCGGRDFVEVQFCEIHHAEANNGLCPYCENEKAQTLREPRTTTQTKPAVESTPPRPVPPPIPVPTPRPAPAPQPMPKPQPVPVPQPIPTPVPDVKTEKSGMGCWGCLVWPTVIIIIIIVLYNIF